LFVQWQVSEGKLGPVKDDDSRIVPIVDSLRPVLSSWRALTIDNDTALCFPPDPRRGGRPGSPPRYRRLHTLHKHLRRALVAAQLPPSLTWYQCTRHTFASHWVIDGGSIEKLRLVLGHSSVAVTERYAHLRGDIFTEQDYQLLTVELE
jgi:integrase